MLQVSDDLERIQLIRALAQRKDFLDSLDPIVWNRAGDRGGTLDEARAATTRLLQRAKKIKIEKGSE